MSAIRNNRFYNDPALGEAFNSLAAAFAPPSGSDAAGWAAANAKNAEAQRLADFYGSAATMDAAQYDRLGPALGLWNPSQGVGVITRGQDVESADRRYGVDVGARTSIANNTADNERALQINAADNSRALEDRRLQEAGSLQRLFAQPVKVGQGERAYLPKATAEATGLPAQLDGTAAPLNESQQLAQIIMRMPGDDQRQFVRDRFAPTESQVQGRERQDLRERGVLSDDELKNTIMGTVPLEEAIGPDGRPQFVRRPDAVGMQPAPKSPQTVINNGPGGDGKLREKLDENEGKRWSDLQGSATTSAGLQQDLGLLGELIDQAPQGPIVGRLAEYFPEATTAGAAFQSIVARAAPGLRVEGSGATSDIEYEGMMRSLPRLRNDPQANRLIVGMMKAKADVNVRRGEIVSAYQNGRIDAVQARDQLSALNRQSILSPGLRGMIERTGGASAPAGEPAAVAVQPGAIEDGYRFRGGDPADAANWELVR